MERFTVKSTISNHGQRVVEGQRLMQAASDIFLGWQRIELPDGGHRDFYVRQLWDWKASASFEKMSPEILSIYASICAWTLARAHARSGSATADWRVSGLQRRVRSRPRRVRGVVRLTEWA